MTCRAASRTHETDDPETEADESQCEIDGQGSLLVGNGESYEFSGPAELADVMLDTGELNRCAITQLYRFSMGRFALSFDDNQRINEFRDRLGEGDFHFDDLILDLVSHVSFRHRLEQEEE